MRRKRALRSRVAGFVALSLVVAGAWSSEPSPVTAVISSTYLNPVVGVGTFSPDPFILYSGGTYYLFSDYDGTNEIELRTSTNLTTWSAVSDAFGTNSLPAWATHGAEWTPWAPAVLYRPDNAAAQRYLMYYTVKRTSDSKLCISVAKASAPGGPYSDSSAGPLVCQASAPTNGSIMPTVIDVPDGSGQGDPHLFWVTRNNLSSQATQIWSQPLNDDGLSFRGGSSATAVLTALTGSGSDDEGTIMHPGVAYDSGASRYVLFYGSNVASSDKHSTRWAYCAAPAPNTGEFDSCTRGQTGSQNEPLMSSRAKAFAPGGAEVFTDENGYRWLVYHASDDPMSLPDPDVREARIDKLCFLNGVPRTTGPSGRAGAVSSTRNANCAVDVPAFGWGASAGTPSAPIEGAWDIDSASGAKALTFTNTNLFRGQMLGNQVVEAEVQFVDDGSTDVYPKYGIRAGFNNADNYVALWIEQPTNADPDRLVAMKRIAGVNSFAIYNLPGGFSFTDWHNLLIKKVGTTCEFYLDRVLRATLTSCNPGNGQMGIFTVDTRANFGSLAQGTFYLNTYTCPTGSPSYWRCYAQKLRRMAGPATLDSSLETSPQPALTTANNTCTGYDACGMDLGYSVDHNGKTYWLFGDTYGSPGHATPPNEPPAPPPVNNWRCNTAAISSDNTPEDGISFDASPNGMIKDGANKAKELLTTCPETGEASAIPTGAVAGTTPNRMYMHYMSVDDWGWLGATTTRHSSIAYSDDNGQTWTRPGTPLFAATSNFAQAAMTEWTDPGNGNEWTFLWGIPAGRYGGVRLALVLTDQLLDKTKYFYWTGSGWSAQGASESVAVELVPGPVGELSVRYQSEYDRWIMMYLDVDRYAIVMRTAPLPQGPWEDARVVLDGYYAAPYLVGGFMPENQPARWSNPALDANVYFTLSEFKPYVPYWAKTSLTTIP